MEFHNIIAAEHFEPYQTTETKGEECVGMGRGRGNGGRKLEKDIGKRTREGLCHSFKDGCHGEGGEEVLTHWLKGRLFRKQTGKESEERSEEIAAKCRKVTGEENDKEERTKRDSKVERREGNKSHPHHKILNLPPNIDTSLQS